MMVLPKLGEGSGVETYGWSVGCDSGQDQHKAVEEM